MAYVDERTSAPKPRIHSGVEQLGGRYEWNDYALHLVAGFDAVGRRVVVVDVCRCVDRDSCDDWGGVVGRSLWEGADSETGDAFGRYFWWPVSVPLAALRWPSGERLSCNGEAVRAIVLVLDHDFGGLWYFFDHFD